MIRLLKKIALSVFGYFVGSIILLFLLSLFIEPDILPDGTSVISNWSIIIIVVYWISLYLVIWKDIFNKLRNSLFGLKNTLAMNSDIDDFNQNGLSLEQIDLINSRDPLLYDVTNYIIETQRASTSNIQRRFGLGYNRAARLIDLLEFSGIVGKENQSMPREILTKDITLLFNYLTNDTQTKNQVNLNDEKLKLIIKDPTLFSNDHQFYKLLKYVIDSKAFNADAIQNLFGLNFALNTQYINTLRLLGVINEDKDYVLSESESYESISNYIKFAYYSNSDYISSLNLDMLKNGLEFESFVGNLLTKNNYIDVVVTQASNDYGIDVTAKKDGIKYAIQCKYYTSPVGNSSIQEVTAGKNHYNAHVGIVATNNYFTKNAIELAKSNNIILWDRDKILSMIKQ